MYARRCSALSASAEAKIVSSRFGSFMGKMIFPLIHPKFEEKTGQKNQSWAAQRSQMRVVVHCKRLILMLAFWRYGLDEGHNQTHKSGRSKEIVRSALFGRYWSHWLYGTL